MTLHRHLPSELWRPNETRRIALSEWQRIFRTGPMAIDGLMDDASRGKRLELLCDRTIEAGERTAVAKWWRNLDGGEVTFVEAESTSA